MKYSIILIASVIIGSALVSCNRTTITEPGAGGSQAVVINPAITHSRIVTEGYSKSISLDTANKMISSYLTSVSYPYSDTATRSLAFDADTLRNYLKDTSITAMKFYLAHQLSYLNGASNRFGKNIGLLPGAITIIAVGINDNGGVVRNRSNGVYEHAMPCPVSCGSEVDAYLH